MDAGSIAALLTALAGIGALSLSIYKSRGEGTSQAISQQTQILQDMKLLNDELRQSLVDTRTERDELKNQVTRLHEEVNRLRNSVDKIAER